MLRGSFSPPTALNSAKLAKSRGQASDEFRGVLVKALNF